MNGSSDAQPAENTRPVSRFFLCHQRELAACSPPALQREDWASADPLTPRQISKLWAIILNQNWSGRSVRGFAFLDGIDEREQRVHRIPVTVVRQLARMSPQELVRVTSAWHENAQAAAEVNVHRVVLELVRLAARSRDTKQRVYFSWWATGGGRARLRPSSAQGTS